ncbi:hypothetical protein UT300012_22400 [Paraclostridium bifermentans]
MILTSDFIRGLHDFRTGMVDKYAEFIYYQCSGESINNSEENFEIAVKGICKTVETLDRIYKDRIGNSILDKVFNELVTFYSKFEDVLNRNAELDKIDLVLILCDEYAMDYNKYSIGLYEKSLFTLHTREVIDSLELDARVEKLYFLARKANFYICHGQTNLDRCYVDMEKEINDPKTLDLDKYIRMAINESRMLNSLKREEEFNALLDLYEERKRRYPQRVSLF